jgi:predicted esterase
MYSFDDWLITQFFMWKKFDARAKLKVTKKIVEEGESKKAIFFFPYWSGKSNLYEGISKNFKDYTLVYYDYPKETLSKNLKVSINYLRNILKDAFNLILDFRKRGYTEIILVGSSLGSNIALKLASMVKVEKLILNMVDRTLAMEILTSPALGILKQRLENEGVLLKNLEGIYKFISTEAVLPIIAKTDTKILLFISKNDIFCNSEQFSPILEQLKRLKINYELKVNTVLGHILSIYKNLYFDREIVKFIKEK